jgi:folate-binding protein YgfZ
MSHTHLSPRLFPQLSPLAFLTPILVAGAEAQTFLQGQLSSDLAQLDAGICQLASCNSPQGRVQAVLTLVPRTDGILVLVPATLAANTLARLRKYVMRSKVTLSDQSSHLQLLSGDRNAIESAGLACPAEPGRYLERDGVGVLRWHETGEDVPARYLVLNSQPVNSGAPHGDTEWLLADIRAGLPQVMAETLESFVAQMLNLDLVGGISFDKGCYTGQEIIARTQYRGAIKRRMFRFKAVTPPPAAGTRILQAGNHAGDVVIAAGTAEGCELLAVINLTLKDAALELASPAGAKLELLPLPYPVVEAGKSGS